MIAAVPIFVPVSLSLSSVSASVSCGSASIHRRLPLSFSLEGLTSFRDSSLHVLGCVCQGEDLGVAGTAANLAHLYSLERDKRHSNKVITDPRHMNRGSSLPLLRPLGSLCLLKEVGSAHPNKLGTSEPGKPPGPGRTPRSLWLPSHGSHPISLHPWPRT